MKILIIDKDPSFSALLTAKIRKEGHEVMETALKSDGLEAVGLSHFDAVFFDPSPLNDPKPILLQVRRHMLSYAYTVMVSATIDRLTALRAGCNDGMAKPFDPEWLTYALTNGQRMVTLVTQLGAPLPDFPSSGGVIAKSAFNQLFLSALDRASRYDELTHLLQISIPNYQDLILDAGKYAADFAISKLAQSLTRLRRQSDILAQTDVNQFTLLLQRPLNETEPLDAARRFAERLQAQDDLTTNGQTAVAINVALIHIPTGALDYHFTTAQTAQGARVKSG